MDDGQRVYVAMKIWYAVVLYVTGDWVAVRMTSKRSREMYVARVEEVVEEDIVFTVSFLKKRADSSYYWPEKEYVCDVERDDLIKLSSPSEEIVSGTSALLNVKLSFNLHEVHAARNTFHVAIKNVL